MTMLHTKPYWLSSGFDTENILGEKLLISLAFIISIGVLVILLSLLLMWNGDISAT